jgi:hypothetical protein
VTAPRVAIFHGGGNNSRINAGKSYSSGTSYGGEVTLLNEGEDFVYYYPCGNDAWAGVAGSIELAACPHPTRTVQT